MKKILMVIATSMVLAACGGNSNQSEANRDADEIESNDPGVTADDAEDMTDDRTTGMDTTMNNSADTTATTSPGVGPAPSN